MYFDTFTTSKDGTVRYRISGKRAATHLRPNGRLAIWVPGGVGSRRFVYVDILIAKEHIQNPSKFADLRHIDGDLTNNRADNLEWVPLCTEGFKKVQGVFYAENDKGMHGPFKSIEQAQRKLKIPGFQTTLIKGVAENLRGDREYSFGYKWYRR